MNKSLRNCLQIVNINTIFFAHHAVRVFFPRLRWLSFIYFQFFPTNQLFMPWTTQVVGRSCCCIWICKVQMYCILNSVVNFILFLFLPNTKIKRKTFTNCLFKIVLCVCGFFLNIFENRFDFYVGKYIFVYLYTCYIYL